MKVAGRNVRNKTVSQGLAGWRGISMFGISHSCPLLPYFPMLPATGVLVYIIKHVRIFSVSGKSKWAANDGFQYGAFYLEVSIE